MRCRNASRIARRRRQSRRADRAGADLLRRRRSHPSRRRGRRLYPSNFCRRCTGFIRRCSITPCPWWRRSTAMPSPAAACSPAAPTAASWRAMPAASASPNCWWACRFPALAFEILRFAVPPRYLAEFALSGATLRHRRCVAAWLDRRGGEAGTADATRSTRAQELARFRRRHSRRPSGRSVRPSSSVWPIRELRPTPRSTEIWCAPGTLGYIRDYVERTLKKR